MKIKNYKFKNLVFAGTFDRLHIGHKKLLDMAFELAEKVSIGITTENLYKSKPLANLIPTEAVRRRLVEQYLRQRNWLKRAKFFRLDDIYGPSIVDREMDSILVTEWTKANAEKINEIRVRRYEIGDKRYLKPLRIIVAPLVRSDDGEVITSERIRLGEIDREGRSYQLSVFPTSLKLRGASGNRQTKLELPRYLRAELRKPLGLVIGGSVDQLSETARRVIKSVKSIKSKVPAVISVGDIVTESLLKINFEPQIKIIDFRSRRKNIDKKSNIKNQISKLHIKNQKYTEINQPGTINLQAGNVIQRAIKEFLNKKKQSWIVIKGEEDLLALPAILFAPLQSVVLYGQIDLGVVVVEVTEEKKKEVQKILSKFG